MNIPSYGRKLGCVPFTLGIHIIILICVAFKIKNNYLASFDILPLPPSFIRVYTLVLYESYEF